jgi:hypothetical protein
MTLKKTKSVRLRRAAGRKKKVRDVVRDVIIGTIVKVWVKK